MVRKLKLLILFKVLSLTCSFSTYTSKAVSIWLAAFLMQICFSPPHARYFPECKAPLLMLCYPLKNARPMIPAGVCWQDMNRELLKNGF